MTSYEGSLFLDLAQQRLLDRNREHANDLLARRARATADQRRTRMMRESAELEQPRPLRADARRFVARSLFGLLGRRRQVRPAA
jgi:hypothetical protein